MNNSDKEVDLASLYNEAASIIGNSNDKELNKILKKIKNEVSKGNFTLKVRVDEDTFDYLTSPSYRLCPDLVSKLQDYGFVCGNPATGTTFFLSLVYYMTISWRKNA